MNKWLNMLVSALAAALVAGGAVAATTHDWWPIGTAAVVSFGTAIVQHLRPLPQKKWTDQERAKKLRGKI